MRADRIAVLAWFTAAASLMPPVSAEQGTATSHFERYARSAQQAFDRGQYKRAETQWGRALGVAAESQTKDDALATTLKRLGETLLKEGRYEDAQRCLKHAAQIDEVLSTADSELTGDLAMLEQTYKPVDVNLLGKFAADVLNEANLTSIGIIKTDSGNRVQIEFPCVFNKHLDNKDVDGIGVNRIVTFEIAEQPDGSVKIDHIRGFRVRAKYWVNITGSEIKPDDSGLHIADVTAQKMGVTRTVHAKLSKDQYAPIAGLIAQMTWVASPQQTGPQPTGLTNSAANDASEQKAAAPSVSNQGTATVAPVTSGPEPTSSGPSSGQGNSAAPSSSLPNTATPAASGTINPPTGIVPEQ